MTLAVILAAGEAARAGGPKIVWPVGGLPAVRRVALAALEAGFEALAITGRWESEVREALAGLDIRLVHNPDFALGQSTSVAAALQEPTGARDLLFLLADQPYITSQILRDLVQFHRANPGTITRPLYKGRASNPVVFDAQRWREPLLALSGDQGGRALIAENPAELNLWPADACAPQCFCDFDTAKEYEDLVHY